MRKFLRFSRKILRFWHPHGIIFTQKEYTVIRWVRKPVIVCDSF